MRISIVTLFPELYEPFLRTSIVGRAAQKGLVHFSLTNLFDLATPSKDNPAITGRVDSPTFGHGAGMLIRPELIEKAIEHEERKQERAYKIFFSPQGTKLDQTVLKKLATILQEQKHIMLLPARYEGMDARVEEHYADCLLSIGDYVLMGGDLPAMVLIEGLLRLIPGVIGKEESVREESFSGPFVDYPEYTAPVEWKGHIVPEVIRSGDHAKLRAWRMQQAVQKTVKCHFEWLRSQIHTKEDIQLARKHIPPHYAILMHDQILLEADRVGTSSVTSLDIHDIARSARSYGIKKYIIVTPLADQQKIIKKLLTFWQTDVGIDYNTHRHEALKTVMIMSSLAEALEHIENEEQKKPLLLATSAQRSPAAPLITYKEQSKVWAHERPVVFIFGTARGLSPVIIEQCEYLLCPVEGFSDFNHLSVRSAAAIIFDRWLGIQPAAVK